MTVVTSASLLMAFLLRLFGLTIQTEIIVELGVRKYTLDLVT